MTPDTGVAPHYTILLASYDGEAFLAEQLDSFAAQEGVSWSLLASDDGSQDRTLDILKAYAAKWQAEGAAHEAKVIAGPRIGIVGNFLHLLLQAPNNGAYTALSDQDDVWFPQKLARAAKLLAQVPPERPALYCAATRICDAELRPIGFSSRFVKAPDFRNALVQSIGGGNTMVLNPAALALVQTAIQEIEAAQSPLPAMHDWWLYQLITGAGGEILRDPEPVLDYRQHGRNAVGANQTLGARLQRIMMVVGSSYVTWNAQNLAALRASQAHFSPEIRQVLRDYEIACSGSFPQRLMGLWRAQVHRQSRLGTYALYMACAFKRL